MKKNHVLSMMAGLLTSVAFFFTIFSGCSMWLLREPKMPESMIEE